MMKLGDEVLILGKRTTLVTKLDIEGGWRVNPKIENLGYWNEDEMRPVDRRRKSHEPRTAE